MNRQELENKIISSLKEVGFKIGNTLPNGHIPFKKDEVDLAFFINSDIMIEAFDEHHEKPDWLGSFGDDVESFVKAFNGRKTYYDKELNMSVWATSQEEADKRFNSVKQIKEKIKKKYGMM